MLPITEPAPLNGQVMIVGDIPRNLRPLADMLGRRGCEVRLVPLGRLALAAANLAPPDLILLDMNMPKTNSYDLCQDLKSRARLSDIPVIFFSALNANEHKEKAFQAGGVDYVCKPFHFEEIQARVETHLKLRQARQAGRELLERTLGGAVKALWALVEHTLPVLALRAEALRDIVRWTARRMEIGDPWQYELAATLCLVGCIAMPDEVFERAYCGQELSIEEDEMFRAHPDNTAQLLSDIPWLEVVAEIIRLQHTPDIDPGVPERSRQGVHLLQLAMELDRRIYQGVASISAIAELKSSGRFDGAMLNALQGYTPFRAEFDVRRLPIRDLRGGMVLDKDVLSKDGNLLFIKEGTVLTEIWIERLENFAKAGSACELLDVRIPRLAGARKLHEFRRGVPGTPAPKTV
jgi:CheY-like chemotaxis protein